VTIHACPKTETRALACLARHLQPSTPACSREGGFNELPTSAMRPSKPLLSVRVCRPSIHTVQCAPDPVEECAAFSSSTLARRRHNRSFRCAARIHSSILAISGRVGRIVVVLLMQGGDCRIATPNVTLSLWLDRMACDLARFPSSPSKGLWELDDAIVRKLAYYAFSKILMKGVEIAEIAPASNQDAAIANGRAHRFCIVVPGIARVDHLAIAAFQVSHLTQPDGTVADVAVMWEVNERTA